MTNKPKTGDFLPPVFLSSLQETAPRTDDRPPPDTLGPAGKGSDIFPNRPAPYIPSVFSPMSYQPHAKLSYQTDTKLSC